MNEDMDIQSLMDRVVDLFSSVDGVRAIYIVNFDSMEMEYNIFTEDKPDQEALELIKNSVKLFTNKDVETAYIEESNKLFLKRLKSKNIVIVIATDSNSRMGKIFSLLNLI